MKILSYLKRHVVIASTIGLVVVVIAVLAGRAATAKPAVVADTGAKKVSLVDVSTFGGGSTGVIADGTVESLSQADLKSETSAQISSINVAVGDSVGAGQVILQLRNADLQAQLAQAQANLALAQGNQGTGAVSLDSSKLSAINNIKDAYSKAYDSVNNQIDPILFNNDGNGGQLQAYEKDPTVSEDIRATRTQLTTDFKNWKAAVDQLNSSSDISSVKAVLATSEKNLTTVDHLMGTISQVLTDIGKYAPASFVGTVNGWKATVGTQRAAMNALSSGLLASDAALSTSNSSQSSSAVASVSIAQAGVDAVQAQLSKTIIRSPISGKISALPLNKGELATPGVLVASVVGGGGLQVKAYVSGEDYSKIKSGAAVTIAGTVKGIVTHISPSLSDANKKVEVIIGITDPVATTNLVVGQNVTVSITGETTPTPTTTGSVSAASSTTSSTTYLLPIQDVKIIPGAAYVFTVDDQSKVKRNDVTLGDVKGDFIEVKGGLYAGMKIVTPVYELDEGQTVQVQ